MFSPWGPAHEKPDVWGSLLATQVLLALAFAFPGPGQFPHVGGGQSAFALLPGGLLAASMCLRTARSPGIDRRGRRAWTLLATSALPWTLNDAQPRDGS